MGRDLRTAGGGYELQMGISAYKAVGVAGDAAATAAIRVTA